MPENTYLTGFPLFLSSIAVALCSFLITLDYSVANVAIPYIAGDLAVSADQGIYVITSFAVGNAVILPITGWLTKRFGLVRLSIIGLLGFVFFSWTCGISRSLEMLVISRFLQGVASGPLVPASQTLMVSIFPPKRRSFAIAIWSTIVITGPVFGPLLGGWISYDVYWPWIFFLNIPLGLFGAFVIATFLKPFETPREKPPNDWIGLILLVIWVSCFQFILDKGEQFDWMNSPIIRTCAAITIVCFVFMIGWELTHPSPILELRLLKIRNFALSIVVIATIYALYFGTIILTPLWLQKNMGYIATWAGFVMAFTGVFVLFFSDFIGKLVNKIGPILPLALSALFFGLACFYISIATTAIDFFHLVLQRLFLGLGMLFFIVPLFTLSMQDIPVNQLPSSTGMFHFIRAMFGGVGTSVFTTMWIRRTIFHHSNLVSEINLSREPVAALYQKLDHMGIAGQKSQAIVNDMANHQAAVLGINDCFYFMGWTFIIVLIIILLLGKQKKTKTA